MYTVYERKQSIIHVSIVWELTSKGYNISIYTSLCYTLLILTHDIHRSAVGGIEYVVISGLFMVIMWRPASKTYEIAHPGH